MKTYWSGATLGMLLEKDDALSDRELYNLLNPVKVDKNEGEENHDSELLHSYPEFKIKKVFMEIDELFKNALQERTALKSSIGLVSTLILLPIFIFSRM